MHAGFWAWRVQPVALAARCTGVTQKAAIAQFSSIFMPPSSNLHSALSPVVLLGAEGICYVRYFE